MSIFSAGGMPNLMTLTAKRTAASFFRTELSTIFLVSNHCHTSVNFSPRVIYAYHHEISSHMSNIQQQKKLYFISYIFFRVYHPTSHTLICQRGNCTIYLTFSFVYIIPLVIPWYATAETVLYILHFLPCISPHQSYIDMPKRKLYFMSYTVFQMPPVRPGGFRPLQRTTSVATSSATPHRKSGPRGSNHVTFASSSLLIWMDTFLQ